MECLRDLETICLKCLQKDSDRRYSTAAALAEDLNRFRRGDAIHARPASAWERVTRWTRRHPVTGTLVSIGLLLATGAAAGLLWIDHQQAVNARAIEEDLRNVAVFGEALELDKARIALARAEGRLCNGAPADLRRRVKQSAGRPGTGRPTRGDTLEAIDLCRRTPQSPGRAAFQQLARRGRLREGVS